MLSNPKGFYEGTKFNLAVQTTSPPVIWNIIPNTYVIQIQLVLTH
jgi:hypothetical protein